RDVRREAQAVRPQRGVELVEHDPRLDAHPSFRRVQIENAVAVLRRVELDARADRLTGLRRASASSGDGAPVLAREAHRVDDVRARAWNDDACRDDLIDAGVGGVERARNGIESDFALDHRVEGALQAVGHPGPTIARGVLRSRPMDRKRAIRCDYGLRIAYAGRPTASNFCITLFAGSASGSSAWNLIFT